MCVASDVVLAQSIKPLVALRLRKKDKGNILSVCFHIVVRRRGKTFISMLHSMTSAKI